MITSDARTSPPAHVDDVAASARQEISPRLHISDVAGEDISNTHSMTLLLEEQLDKKQATFIETMSFRAAKVPAAMLLPDAYGVERWYGCNIIKVKPNWPNIRFDNKILTSVEWTKLRFIRTTTER